MYRKIEHLVLGTIFFFILINGVNGSGSNSNLVTNNSCIDCHKNINPYSDEQVQFNDIIVNHTERNVSCSLDCHKDIIRKMAIDNYQQWTESSHASYYVTCDNCHGGNPKASNMTMAHIGILNTTDANSSIYFKNIPETCGKCHTSELENFENTMHYQRLQADALAPSCITCHSPHTFTVPGTLDITKVCSICHNPTNLPSLTSVPKDAKNALDKVTYFNSLLIDTKNYITDAKSSGKDTTTAQYALDNAISISDNIPSMWHRFDLKSFDQNIQKGIDTLENARNGLVEENNTQNNMKAPNIPIAMVIMVLFVAYWLITRLIRK